MKNMIFQMCNSELWTRVFVLVILSYSIVSTGASPARQKSICGPAACKEGNKFHYRAGNIYAYQYVINGTTSIESGPTEESGLHLSSQVAIKFISACDAVLFMRDVNVWQSHTGNGGQPDEHHFTSQDSQLSRALEEFPLRFSYADGIIEEICPYSSESTQALNVKRGLLSTLQNTMRRLDLEHKGEEDDVHGKCKVDYKLGLATSSSLTITRIKDISSCGDKFGILSSVQGTPYSLGTLHQSMPAVSSTSDCQHVVDRNLLTEIRCSETHSLKSLSRGKAGAVTNLYQTLKIIAIHDPDNVTGIGSGPDESLSYILPTLPDSLTLVISETPGNVFKRESLWFRHDYHLGRVLNDYDTAKTALASFCSSVKDEVRGESGQFFESLVNVLRGLTTTDMMRLSQEATNICQGDRTLFNDALEAVGTAASVGVIKDRILKGDVPRETIESWIASLTYIPKPDLSLMQSAIHLMKIRKTYPQIILTLSSLSHTYCRHHPKCTTDKPIHMLIQYYERTFNQECVAKTPEEVFKILQYLKGIGNFGQLSPDINSALKKCIEENGRAEVRVAAIDAYRRMSCPTDVSLLKNLFENELEDAEVRIAAFIGLMRCPTYSTIRWIKELLESEEVNQVGSFVWTYLKNIQETALPSKAELQGLVADEKLSKKFAANAKKFSRNLEVSTFYDDYNLGIGLDGNLIFSQNSYLPRSAALNLTVDLFGESINVFEVTFRMENFEHYIESLFGPNGKFSNKDLAGIVSSLREKRSVPSKRRLRTLSLDYDASRRYYSDPLASLSVRTFGNEVFFGRKVGTSQHEGILKSMDPTYFLKRLAEKDTNWQKSTMLLDSSYIIPTGAGLPLNLSAQASALLRMKATGMKIDVDNFRANSEFKLRGEVAASAILTVMGSMVLGTVDLQTGIKVKAHLRSSTSMEANVHVKGMKLLQAEFGLPKTQMELLEYRSDVMFMKGNAFHVVGEVSELTPVCTGDFFGNTLGLKLCRSSYFSLSPGSQKDDFLAPYFPLNGPAHFTLSLDKANVDLTTSRIHYEWNEEEKRTKLSAKYEIKGSQNTQVVDLAFDLNRLNQDFLFGVKLPSNEFEVLGHLDPDYSNGRLNISIVSKDLVILETQISYDTPEKSNERRVVEPAMLVTLNTNKVLDAKGKVRLEEGNGVFSFDGKLQLDLETLTQEKKRVNIELRGSRNDTSLTLVWDAEYKTSDSNIETIRWKSTISKFQHQESQQIDTTFNLDFSEFPDYNLGASWKYQENEDGLEYGGELRIGRGPSWTDRDALKIRHSAIFLRNYDGGRCEWMFRISQPSKQRDWGLEARLNSHGKSLDSAINLQYAPDKNLQTSLSLKRAPGVLTFLQIGWNITASNQHPLQVSLHLQETTHRVYQGKFGADWFGSNSITVDMDFTDRSRRQHLDKDLKLSIQTSTLDLLKLRSHIYSDDKEAKLLLSTEYHDSLNSFEVGHTVWNKGKRHKLFIELRTGPTVYLVTSEIETDNRFEWILKTDLSSKFPDLLVEMRLKDELGLYTFGLNYKWDASRNRNKKFLVEYFMDLSSSYHQRTELVFTYPEHNFSFLADHRLGDDESRAVMGSLRWDDEEHLHLNARLSPFPRQNAYEIRLGAVTSFQDFQNVSLTMRLNCVKPQDCLINVDGTWGKDGRVSGSITSALQHLSPEETEDEVEDHDEDESGEDDRGNGSEMGENRKMKSGKKPGAGLTFKPETAFSWTLKTNMTTSLANYEVVRISMLHTQWSPLHHKTDFDIQLPEGNEITIASQWRIPKAWKEMWHTQAELHYKSTFPNSPNFQLRGLVGQQDDSDTIAWAGIYADNFQYGIKITGTPRFQENGVLGFEITTSHPNYDKIFGSLSYAIGDNSRLACQLGWPAVVIGLETGFKWSESWEEFQVFYTFTSPWEYLKNINALAKIDSAQVEIKAEVNQVGIATKCEWVIESFETFDIRFDASSPFEEMKRIGLIVKNSFEDEVMYHSQVSFWVNENQIGYKLEGGFSEVEEDNVVARIRNLQIEVDTIVYPTVRSTFNLAQRDSKFNLGLSLLLREGPINVSCELHLLDLFRFNEKITITTPYPGLFELEINLTPAIMPDSEMYNFGLHTRWRSNSEWKEGGLFIRHGDQSALTEALESDIAEAAVFDYPENDEEDDEDDDDAEEQVEQQTPKPKRVIVPQSQLFHFYSPLTWAKIVKLEYKTVVSLDEDNENEAKTKSHFPIRNFALVYSSDNAQLSTSLRNDLTVRAMSARIDLREVQIPISVRFDATLDLTDVEKKLNVNAASDHPKRQEIYLIASWQKQEQAYMSGNIELRTPFENWEAQSMNGMYARSDQTHALDWEFSSDTLGKGATTVTIGPMHYSLILNLPFEELKDLDFRVDITPMEGSTDTFTTLISLKKATVELVQVELEIKIENKWPTQMNGSITTDLKNLQHGNLKAVIKANQDFVNANGTVKWEKEQLNLTFALKIPQNKFENLDVKVVTNFEGYEQWKLNVRQVELSENEDKGDENENSLADNGDYDWKPKVKLTFQAETPFAGFESVEGQHSFQMGSSFFHVKKVTLSGNAPNGSLDITTSWIISEWNRFDIHCDSKYSLQLSSPTPSLQTLPATNYLKFKLKNVIPNTVSSLDSDFHFETPFARAGGTAFMKLLRDESLTVKASALLSKTTHAMELKTLFDDSLNSINSELIYSDGSANHNYTSTLKVTRARNLLEGEAEIEWGRGKFSQFQSRFNSSFTNKNWEFHVQVLQPQSNTNYPQLVAVIDSTFDKISGRHMARLEAETGQEKPLVIELDTTYLGIQDMTSSLNVTSPFTTIPSAGLRVVSKILRNKFKGLFDAHIAEERASVNYGFDYDNQPDSLRLEGSVAFELPFHDLQSGSIKGFLKSKPTATQAQFQSERNSAPYVTMDYEHTTSSSAGKEKDFIKLDVQNSFWPLGITRTYQYDYSGGYEGLNLPTTTVRLVELYDLGPSRDLHKLGGELRIHTNFNGREITLTGIHPSRRMKLSSSYKFLDHRFQQNSSFSWSPDSLIGYDLDVRNLTTSDKSEHRVGLRVSYPIRVIALNTGFESHGSGFRLSSDVNFNQTRNERKLSGIFNWDVDKSTPQNIARRMSLVIKHPALAQDIRADGEFKVVNWESANCKLSLDYVGDPNKRLTLMLKTLPTFSGSYWNLTSDMRLEHSATNLDLTALSTNRHSAHELSIITLIDFKNSGSEGRKSKIAFELFKELRKLHIMLRSPAEQFELIGYVAGQYPVYVLQAEENITGVFPHPKAEIRIDFKKPYVRMYAVHGPDLTDGIYADGGLIDSRNVKFDISESYDNYRFTDVSFFLRINHSRLVTSKLLWRPELLDELQAFVLNRINLVGETWIKQSNQFVSSVSSDGSEVAEKIWEDAKLTIGPFLDEIRDDLDFERDAEAARQFLKDSLTNNDFYIQDISSLAQIFAEEVSVRFSNIFIKVREYRSDLLGETSTSEMFEQTLLWILEKMKVSYRQMLIVWKMYKFELEWPQGPSITFPDFREKITSMVLQVKFYGDNFIQKILSICAATAVNLFNIGIKGLEIGAFMVDNVLECLASFIESVDTAIAEKLQTYKPTILASLHRVESFFYNILLKFSEYMYETREDVKKSGYYKKLAHLAEDVDDLYQDLLKNNASTNFQKYSRLTKDFISKKFGDIDEYEKQLGEMGTYVSGMWSKFKNLKYVKSLKSSIDDCKGKMTWLVDYFRLDNLLQESIVILYNRGGDLLYQTVLEAGSRYQHAKTKFMFDVDKGIMDWQQKLPMPWSEFDQSPVFSELPEYKNVLKAQELFQSTRGSILDVYYKAKYDNFISWLPPSDGYAMLVGSEYFFTYDGRFYNYTGPCVYLLTADLVDGNFSVSIQYTERRDGSLGHQIIVMASHNTLIIDFEDKTIKDPKKSKNSVLPMQTQNLEGYKDRDNLVVETKNKGLTVSCNIVYWVCQFRVSGWYSRKVGGLLGTMDHEPTTDLIYSNGKVASDVNDMAKSWDVSDDGTQPCLSYQSEGRISRSDLNPKTISTCTKLFHSRLSSLQPCFSSVKVDPFKRICLTEKAELTNTVCRAASAYVTMCQTQGILVEMPSYCIKCDLNGEEMIDHDVKEIDSSSPYIPSMDIVLIVEAKDCNKNIRTKKKLDTLISVLETELANARFEKTRYAVVIFGGTSVSAKPHAISHNNTIFTDAQGIAQYLTHIPTGNGSLDIFGALAYSLKLSFRPRVSKTLILLPCSTCQPQHMTMDFSTIHYTMLEQDATLHILMNNDFPSDNKKVAKKFFGMDKDLAYTKADGENGSVRGNANLRRQVKISKNTMGYCTPLALQTNGTIFNGKKLQNKRENIVELFSTVFSKRVIKNAVTPKCKVCYCLSNDDGLGRVECISCEYPRQLTSAEVDNSETDTDEEDLFIPETTSTPIISITHSENSLDSKFENEEEEEEEDDEEETDEY